MSLIINFVCMQELYDRAFEAIKRQGLMGLVAPCCGEKPMHYYLYGSYQRNVTDLVPVENQSDDLSEDQRTEMMFETDIERCTSTLNVRRIACVDCQERDENGRRKVHTHALLFQFLVPYGRYSIRYIVYHIYHFYQSGVSMEEYCFNAGINESQMGRWICWLKSAIPFLIDAGLLPSDFMDTVKDGRAAMQTLSKALYMNFDKFYRALMEATGKVIFQTHAYPKNTVHHAFQRIA